MKPLGFWSASEPSRVDTHGPRKSCLRGGPNRDMVGLGFQSNFPEVVGRIEPAGGDQREALSRET